MGAELQVSPGTSAESYEYDEVYIRNQPDRYIGQEGLPGILCRDDLLACTEFQTDDATWYFKDPVLLGNSFC